MILPDIFRKSEFITAGDFRFHVGAVWYPVCVTLTGGRSKNSRGTFVNSLYWDFCARVNFRTWNERINYFIFLKLKIDLRNKTNKKKKTQFLKNDKMWFFFCGNEFCNNKKSFSLFLLKYHSQGDWKQPQLITNIGSCSYCVVLHCSSSLNYHLAWQSFKPCINPS